MIEVLLNFLNANSGVFSLLFSFIVALATIMYVRYTKSLTEETRKLRKIQSEPHISVAIVSTEHYLNTFYIEIENIGQGPAYEISIDFKPDFISTRKGNINSLSFIKKTSYLKPGQKIKSFIGTFEHIKDNRDKEFIIAAFYKDLNGNNFLTKNNFDLKEILDLSRSGNDIIYNIAKDINSIADVIKKVGSGWHKIKVEIYTQEDLSRESLVDKIENNELKDSIIERKQSDS